MDTFMIMVQTMITSRPSEQTEQNAERSAGNVTEAPVITARNQVQPPTAEAERRQYGGQRETRSGTSVTYRNSGGLRTESFADVLRDSRPPQEYHSRRSVGDERGIGNFRNSDRGAIHPHRNGYRPRYQREVGTRPNVNQDGFPRKVLPMTEDQSLEEVLFKGCQLKQAKRNWVRTPVSIAKQVDKIFQNINPPQGSEEFRNKIRSVGEQCKHNLCDTVAEHVAQRCLTVNMELTKHSGSRFDQIASRVRRRFLAHSNGRVSYEEVTQWLCSDLDVMTRRRMDEVQLTDPTTTEVSPSDMFITVSTPSHRRSSQKRERQEESSPVEGRNPFSPLSDLPEEEDRDMGCSPRVIPTKKNTKKPRKTQGNGDNTKAQEIEEFIEFLDYLDNVSTNEEEEDQDTSGPPSPPKVRNTPKEQKIRVECSKEVGEVAADITDEGVEVMVESSKACDVITGDVTRTEDLRESIQDTYYVNTTESPFLQDEELEQESDTDDVINYGVPDDVSINEEGGEVCSEEEKDEETDISGEPASPRLVQSNSSQPAKTNGGLVKVHTERPKSNWQVKVGESTEMLFLSDDNLIRFGEVPVNWEFHIFREATLSDFTNLINKLQITRGLRAIAVSVGWYNRNRKPSNIQRDINAIACAIDKKNIEKRFFGPVAPRGQPVPPGVAEFNVMASRRFDENFIFAPSEYGDYSEWVTLRPSVNYFVDEILACRHQ
jgi:hypothetical protein